MKVPSPIARKLRCAVYTRKSTEEGLEQEFNSLDAQREACEAYIASQRAEGWVLVPDHYDDGGVSGATLERPALRRLLAEIEASKVDVVVVYKIDRLSRALMDFAKLVEVFDRNGVTFVSVTQSFNTTTSMGRLTLNILLSFAQFEREVIGERIRDKFAASRRKGMWMGGWAPLGYDIKDRKLAINEPEAKLVRSIFTRFAGGVPPRQLIEAFAKEGALNKQGKPIDKGYLYRILNNRVYLGEAVHKAAHRGEHAAIIGSRLWDQVHALIDPGPRARANRQLGRTPALLKGLIFGPTGAAMTPTSTRKRGRLYRAKERRITQRNTDETPDLTDAVRLALKKAKTSYRLANQTDAYRRARHILDRADKRRIRPHRQILAQRLGWRAGARGAGQKRQNHPAAICTDRRERSYARPSGFC